jgi:methyl-accepting chemotaxis protein
MNDMIEQIAQAAREQSDVSQAIAQNVEAISSSEQESAAWIGEGSQDLTELADTAARLERMVGRFTL